MSLDQQVALTRSTRGESTHLSKAARQVVPPFLQKLYEIVSDSRNEELIRWSENGDSFYVLNHERFAREVLGRWFKHQKFTSFVRQLNMYGFHKIPQLQQGVLKSDTDTEPWHFEHPHFHRGQPDLLCLIQRKKQPTHGGEDAAMDYGDTVNSSVPLGNLPTGQVMDINAIVNGIATIKRHQQAISDDLNDLKKANDVLWAEAVESRKRHEKHEDTINRILKFLAGVFGSAADHVRKNDRTPSPHAVVPRMRQMLMIGDGGGSTKGKTVHMPTTGVVEEREDSRPALGQERSDTPFSIEQYASIETPEPTLASPSVSLSEPFSPVNQRSAADFVQSTEIPRASDTGGEVFEPVSLSGMGGNEGNKSVWQAALQQMLSSPAQMQKLMQALAVQHHYPVTSPLETSTQIESEPHSQIMPYDSHHGDHASSTISQLSRVHSDDNPNTSGSLSMLGSPTRSADDNALLRPLMDNANRIDNSYRAAADIDADMDAIQTSINSLIQDMGIDPNSIQNHVIPDPVMPTLDGSVIQTNATPNSSGSLLTDSSTPARDASGDFDFDALLNEFSSRNDQGDDYADIINRYNPLTRIDGTRVADASTEQLTAFLDEVSDTASPRARSPDVSGGGGGTGGRKRKSNVADMPLPPTTTLEYSPPGPKTKRKR